MYFLFFYVNPLDMRPVNFDESETDIFSDEVLELYLKHANSESQGYLIHGMPLHEFVSEYGLNETGIRIYRDVKLHIQVADEVDVRDETIGNYHFSYDATDPNWYVNLISQINSVIGLKEDFQLLYNGKSIDSLKGPKILLDEKRNVAILKVGSETSRQLLGNGKIGSKLQEMKNALEKEKEMQQRIQEELRADPYESPLSSVDEEEYENGNKKYMEDKHLWKVYNSIVSSTVSDFVTSLQSRPTKQWAS